MAIVQPQTVLSTDDLRLGWRRLLLDQAYVLEGEPVGDPTSFGKRMTEMMQKAFAG